MSRTFLVTCLVFVGLHIAPSTALAQGNYVDTVTIERTESGQIAGRPGSRPVSVIGAQRPAGFIVTWPQIDTAPDGAPCLRWITRPGSPQEQPAFIDPLITNTTPCPGQPPTPPIDPQQWVRTYLATHNPQPPNPHFIPPHAITGEPMYLLTDAPTTWNHHTTTTPFGPLHLTGTATITINWGDTTTTTGHTQPGQPWPHGQLTHTYTHTGTTTITATYHWHITWNFPDLAGTIPLTHTTTLPNYPITELQPTIRYP